MRIDRRTFVKTSSAAALALAAPAIIGRAAADNIARLETAHGLHGHTHVPVAWTTGADGDGLFHAVQTLRRLRGLLVGLGAFDPGLAAEGQYWRFLSANFLHADWGHLLNNMFGMLIFGKMVEPVIGGRAFAGLCLVTGLAAMIASALLLPGPTLGASGIVYGLIGAYITLVLLITRFVEPGRFQSEAKGAIAFMAIYIFLNLTESAGINIWGHLGGALAGMLFAFALFQHRLRHWGGKPQT